MFRDNFNSYEIEVMLLSSLKYLRSYFPYGSLMRGGYSIHQCGLKSSKCFNQILILAFSKRKNIRSHNQIISNASGQVAFQQTFYFSVMRQNTVGSENQFLRQVFCFCAQTLLAQLSCSGPEACELQMDGGSSFALDMRTFPSRQSDPGLVICCRNG